MSDQEETVIEHTNILVEPISDDELDSVSGGADLASCKDGIANCCNGNLTEF